MTNFTFSMLRNFKPSMKNCKDIMDCLYSSCTALNLLRAIANCCIFAFQILWVSSAHATSIYVTNHSSSSTGSLRHSIAIANSGDTIKFTANTNGIPFNLGGTEVNFNKSIVILGNGIHQTIIDGQEQSRVFHITGGDVQLRRLTIQNGRSRDAGAGIRSKATLLLHKCRIAHNRSLGYPGGGIYNNEANLTIEFCTIEDNRCATAGGGIYNEGSLTARYSTFKGNIAPMNGGGVSSRPNRQAVFHHSIFTANSSPFGAGIYVSSSSTAHFFNCSIGKNDGSGIRGNTSTYPVLLVNTIVSGNIDLHDVKCKVDTVLSCFNLIGLVSGHELRDAHNGNIVGQQAQFVAETGNLQLQCGSPAIDAGSNSKTSGAIDNILNPRLVNGHTDMGALELQLNFSGLLVTHGGDTGPGTLRSAISSVCPNGIIRVDSRLDGTVHELDTQIEISKQLVIMGNGTGRTVIDGGRKTRLFEIAQDGNLTLRDLTLRNGKTTGSNTAGNGGAILNFGSLTLHSTHIHHNEANNGGAIWSSNAICRIANSHIKGNYALLNGGGLHITFGSYELRNTLISGNKSNTFGGGIYCQSDISIFNCTMAGNYSSTGGGIYANGGDLTLANNIIATNSALTGTDLHIFGTATDMGHNLIGDATLSKVTWSASTQEGSSTHPIDPHFISDVPHLLPSRKGNLRLQPKSSAINQATIDTTGLLLGATDVGAQNRILGNRIDIGAYEFSNKILGATTLCSGSIVHLSIDESLVGIGHQWTYHGLGKIIGDNSKDEVILDLTDDSAGGLLTLQLNSSSTTYSVDIQILDASECTSMLCAETNIVASAALMASGCFPEQIHALETIQSDGVITTGKSYTFLAETSILLSENFSVEEGGSLEIQIKSCAE